MNITAFFYVSVRIFLTHSLQKKAHALLRAGRDAGVSGQVRALDKAVAFWQ